jgi:predicted RNA-binding Zn ribbon-like protein
MPTTPRSLSFAPHLPFKYVAGDPALDLVNTVDWTSGGLVEDRLSAYDRFAQWAEGAEIVVPRLAAHFQTEARARPDAAAKALREAVRLRWVLRQIFVAVARGESVTTLRATSDLNALLTESLSHLQLAGKSPANEGAAPLQWSWRDAASRLDSLLWPVVRSAAELLASDEANQIHECGGTDCGWMYVDRSRNGLRRWCEMESCGTREKSRQRAQRRAART